MYLVDAEVSLTVTTEQIDGKNLLIRKFGIGVVAESLAVETQSRLIDITDIPIQNKDLSFIIIFLCESGVENSF